MVSCTRTRATYPSSHLDAHPPPAPLISADTRSPPGSTPNWLGVKRGSTPNWLGVKQGSTPNWLGVKRGSTPNWLGVKPGGGCVRPRLQRGPYIHGRGLHRGLRLTQVLVFSRPDAWRA